MPRGITFFPQSVFFSRSEVWLPV